MSIIIKGMDIPKDCSYCILANEHINGLCKKKYYCRLEADFEHCPLVEIPTPHGRLIDADELRSQMEDALISYRLLPNYPTYGDSTAMAYLDLAPTILEAEE